MLLKRRCDRMYFGSVGASWAYLDVRDRGMTICFLFGGRADV